MLVTSVLAVALVAALAAVVVTARMWRVESARHATTRRALEQVHHDLDAAGERGLELEQRLGVAEARAEDLATEGEQLRRERSDLREQLTGRRQDAEDARAAAATARVELAAARRAGHDAGALWALELARSERRWRLGVAPGMHLDSPFATSTNPLATAVEVESAALHEEVGTTFQIDWQVTWPVPAEVAVLAVRLCEEILAACAKSAETVQVRATREHQDLVIAVSARDERGGTLLPVLPAVGDGRVELSQDHVRIRGAMPDPARGDTT